MNSPTVVRWSPSAAAPVSCGLCASNAHDGLHLGLIVREENKPHYVLHMGWHEETPIAEPQWARPGSKKWLFAGSDAAAGRIAVAQTVNQTAQLERVDPLAQLPWLLERAAACRDWGGLYADLDPAAFKEAW